MIEAIEYSTGNSIPFNSQQELYFYDMFMAYEHKNITPCEFRKISTSDWNMIKAIKTPVDERLEVMRLQKIEEEKMKAEMNSRRSKYGSW